MMLHKQSEWNQENQVRELCKTWHPKRGEVYLCEMGVGLGSEYKGLRPIVVLSNNINNIHSTVIQVAPITSAQGKASIPVHVRLDQRDNLKNPSIISIEQTKCISKERCFINGNLIRITQLSDSKIEEINQAVKIQFDLI